MSELLMHSMIDKVDAGEKKISELSKKIDQLPNHTQTLADIKSDLQNVCSDIQKITFPEKEVRQLTLTMETSIALFKQPLKHEIIHHHHASKLIWITAALFIIICVEASGWYMTANRLDMYKANDTKYRYLKLQGDKTLYNWLRLTDSLNSTNSRFRDAVIAQEDQNQREFEMMQRALEMEKEARELKQNIRKNKVGKNG